MSEFHHVSVLLDECIEGLAIKPEGIYVDGTLGGAGHSSQIPARLTTGRLIGIDREVMIVGRAGQAEIWDAEEFARFEAENLTPEKLLASLEAIGL